MNLTQQQKDSIVAARRAYQKTWREKNPDKVKAAQERHWLKKAQQMFAKQPNLEGADDERGG